jgi:hypothetical protein
MATPADPTNQQSDAGWTSQAVTPADPVVNTLTSPEGPDGGPGGVQAEKARAQAAEALALTTQENVAANVDSLASDADLPTTVTAVNALLSALVAAGLMSAGS